MCETRFKVGSKNLKKSNILVVGICSSYLQPTIYGLPRLQGHPISETTKPTRSRAARGEEMYVTRPLSRYLADPKSAAEPPPEGPGSGFLVVLDEATEQASTLCCGLCLDPRVRRLPFPQNRQLSVKQGNSSDPLEHVLQDDDGAELGADIQPGERHTSSRDWEQQYQAGDRSDCDCAALHGAAGRHQPGTSRRAPGG